jgi:hypothetical protein
MTLAIPRQTSVGIRIQMKKGYKKFYFLTFVTDFQAPGEAFSPPREHPAFQSISIFYSFCGQL